MAAPDKHTSNCKCWHCFIQENFTSVSLFFVVIFGMILAVVVMHEKNISEKGVDFVFGFVGGAFSTWTLSLKSTNQGQHQGDTLNAGDNTTVVQRAPVTPPPVPEVAPLENPATPVDQEQR